LCGSGAHWLETLKRAARPRLAQKRVELTHCHEAGASTPAAKKGALWPKVDSHSQTWQKTRAKMPQEFKNQSRISLNTNVTSVGGDALRAMAAGRGA
jgi:hypothetical protein